MLYQVGDTIALSARHKIAASDYYSGLRGSREPNEVQATIIGVVQLLVSLSFSFIQILMVHGSWWNSGSFYKRSGFKSKVLELVTVSLCSVIISLSNDFNGLRLFMKSPWSCYWKIQIEVKPQQYKFFSIKVSPVNVFMFLWLQRLKLQ